MWEIISTPILNEQINMIESKAIKSSYVCNICFVEIKAYNL